MTAIFTGAVHVTILGLSILYVTEYLSKLDFVFKMCTLNSPTHAREPLLSSISLPDLSADLLKSLSIGWC